ncbi:MAG: 2-keto-4-pentenoate hydratase [Acidimicrobiaceae bacterium]|nr:2-keto-4-pentenoate hydratase [Acidimicrobiaceae bacterium]
MIDDATVDVIARELRRAEFDGGSCELPSARIDGLTWADARAIARRRDALRLDDGDTLIGYKLGWTSKAMREALNIARPNWGTLWRSQVLDGRLDLGRLRHPKAEPEIVFVAAEPIEGPSATAGDVLSLAAGWALGIEVVHPRWASYDFTWLDNTADNSSSSGVVINTPTTEGFADQQDVADATVEFSDETTTRRGKGSAAMGSPAEAVAWLARSLADEGERIEGGQLVFTGGLTAPFDVTAGGLYTARSPKLGEVRLVAHGSS